MSRVVVPPIVTELDGAKVHIIEITSHDWVDGKRHYVVTCFIEWNGFKSKTFSLDVTSNRELEAKLRTEIAKMKLMIMSGRTEFFSRTS